jgi:hypothetical protein
MSDIVRVLRVIEYSGPREAVENHLRQAMRQGDHRYSVRDRDTKQLLGYIDMKIATVGDFPEITGREPYDAKA